MWRICGFEDALAYFLTDEDFVFELTHKLADTYVAVIKAFADVPADAYLFGDDWGDQRGVMTGAPTWRKFLKPCWEKVYAEVHRQGKKVIQHSCGSISEIYPDLHEIGMDCHESVQPEAANMEPAFLKEKYGNIMSFWGMLGSQGILKHGSPDEIRREIFRLRDLFRESGGHILAPSKPLMDEMEIEKAAAVIDTLSELDG